MTSSGFPFSAGLRPPDRQSLDLCIHGWQYLLGTVPPISLNFQCPAGQNSSASHCSWARWSPPPHFIKSQNSQSQFSECLTYTSVHFWEVEHINWLCDWDIHSHTANKMISKTRILEGSHLWEPKHSGCISVITHSEHRQGFFTPWWTSSISTGLPGPLSASYTAASTCGTESQAELFSVEQRLLSMFLMFTFRAELAWCRAERFQPKSHVKFYFLTSPTTRLPGSDRKIHSGGIYECVCNPLFLRRLLRLVLQHHRAYWAIQGLSGFTITGLGRKMSSTRKFTFNRGNFF